MYFEMGKNVFLTVSKLEKHKKYLRRVSFMFEGMLKRNTCFK